MDGRRYSVETINLTHIVPTYSSHDMKLLVDLQVSNVTICGPPTSALCSYVKYSVVTELRLLSSHIQPSF